MENFNFNYNEFGYPPTQTFYGLCCTVHSHKRLLPFVVDGPIRVSFTTFGKLVFVIKGSTQDKINGIKPLANMDLVSLRLL